MSFRTRCTGAIYGAFLFTIGAPLIFLDTRRNAERVISGDVDPLSRRVAKTVYSTGAAVPTLVLCGVTALLYPAVGWLAAPLTLAISCAIGAAFGAVLLDLTEPAPLGTPGNPRPMPSAAPASQCEECHGSGWVSYPHDRFADMETRCVCNPMEAPPLGLPEPRCAECGDAGWVLYPGSEPGDYDRCYSCADEYDARNGNGPDLVAQIETGEITLADFKTATRARLYGC